MIFPNIIYILNGPSYNLAIKFVYKFIRTKLNRQSRTTTQLQSTSEKFKVVILSVFRSLDTAP
jgi:hypothetical protein